jgi:predicted TIM-barrel fold metal-dependent hydrolase
VIVDGHFHLFRRVSADYPRAVHDLFPPEREALAEDFLTVMAANGVSRGVVVPVSPDDAYLLDCLRLYPRSFVGVAVLDEKDPDPLERLKHVTDLGIQGLRVPWLGDPGTRRAEELPLYPTLQRMAKGGQKVWFYAPPDQLPLLEMVTAALPDLNVVLNHLGFFPTGFTLGSDGLPHIPTDLPAPTLPSVVALARRPNVYVMLSGQYGFSKLPYPYDDLTTTVRALFDSYGPDRMFWASDYPWIAVNPGYDRMIELPNRQLPHLSAADLDKIMGGTVSRLFGLEDLGAESDERPASGSPD